MFITHQPVFRRVTKNDDDIDRYCFRTYYDNSETEDLWATSLDNANHAEVWVIFTNQRNGSIGAALGVPVKILKLSQHQQITWEMLENVKTRSGEIRMPCELMDYFDLEVLTESWVEKPEKQG